MPNKKSERKLQNEIVSSIKKEKNSDYLKYSEPHNEFSVGYFEYDMFLDVYGHITRKKSFLIETFLINSECIRLFSSLTLTDDFEVDIDELENINWENIIVNYDDDQHALDLIFFLDISNNEDINYGKLIIEGVYSMVKLWYEILHLLNDLYRDNF